MVYEHGAKPDAILDKTTGERAIHMIANFNSLICFGVLLR